MLNDFQNSVTGRFGSKFAISLQRANVATLSREILMSESLRRSKKCVVINDSNKSQGSVATHQITL